jgi:signal transduction histidine kinase
VPIIEQTIKLAAAGDETSTEAGGIALSPPEPRQYAVRICTGFVLAAIALVVVGVSSFRSLEAMVTLASDQQFRAPTPHQHDLLMQRSRAGIEDAGRTLDIIIFGSVFAIICTGFASCYAFQSLQALRASSDELVSSHTQLNLLNEELGRSNGELEQFAYSASHDLQEPLRMIASYVQLLRDRYRGRLDADADDFIDFAVDGATRMKCLINDLLVYSRAGRGHEPQAVDAEQALEWALSNLSLRIGETHTTVTHATLPTVKADPGQLGEVFQNLIDNAIKFHGNEPPRIDINVSRRDSHWLFSVKDNGIGIEPQHQGRVFQMFQRLHGRNEYSGTGIGLAVCRKIVERHGGRIWIESARDSGADFRFTLPALDIRDGTEALT